MTRPPSWLDSLNTTEDSRYASESIDSTSFIIFDKRCVDVSYAYLLFSTQLNSRWVLITIAKVTPYGTPDLSIFQTETFQVSMYCERTDIVHFTMTAMIQEIINLDINLDNPIDLAYKFGGTVNGRSVIMPIPNPKLYQ